MERVTDESVSNDSAGEADEGLKTFAERVKDVAEAVETNPSETMITISVAEALEIVQQLKSANERIEWLERKKRTLADLARSAHNWSKARLELADKRILHVEEVLDAAQGFYDELTDDTEFKKGYRAALYWFKSEILDDELFAAEKNDSDDAKD